MPTASISHVVVTRFSMPFPEKWRRKAYGEDSNRGAWLKYRADILEATLSRSLRHQTTRPIRAYLLCDPADEAFCKKNIDRDLYKPLFCDGRTQIIAEDLVRTGLTKRVALSRIDSDDIVGKDYFSRIDKAITEMPDREEIWMVAVNGFRTDFKALQRLYYNCSPFLTRYVAQLRGEDVYALNHEDIVHRQHVQLHEAEWMQVIHGGNLENTLVANVRPGEFTARVKRNPKFAAKGVADFDPGWFRDWAGFDVPALPPPLPIAMVLPHAATRSRP